MCNWSAGGNCHWEAAARLPSIYSVTPLLELAGGSLRMKCWAIRGEGWGQAGVGGSQQPAGWQGHVVSHASWKRMLHTQLTMGLRLGWA